MLDHLHYLSAAVADMVYLRITGVFDGKAMGLNRIAILAQLSYVP